MPTAPDDKQAIEDSLNDLVERDLEVTDEWISDEELAAKHPCTDGVETWTQTRLPDGSPARP